MKKLSALTLTFGAVLALSLNSYGEGLCKAEVLNLLGNELIDLTPFISANTDGSNEKPHMVAYTTTDNKADCIKLGMVILKKDAVDTLRPSRNPGVWLSRSANINRGVVVYYSEDGTWAESRIYKPTPPSK